MALAFQEESPSPGQTLFGMRAGAALQTLQMLPGGWYFSHVPWMDGPVEPGARPEKSACLGCIRVGLMPSGALEKRSWDCFDIRGK